jgi:hypothetical protein
LTGFLVTDGLTHALNARPSLEGVIHRQIPLWICWILGSIGAGVRAGCIVDSPPMRALMFPCYPGAVVGKCEQVRYGRRYVARFDRRGVPGHGTRGQGGITMS